MLEIKVSLEKIDYSSLLPFLLKAVTKSKVLSKALRFTLEGKISKMTEEEKNSFAAFFIEEHNEKIVEILNEYAKNKGVIAYMTDISAKIT